MKALNLKQTKMIIQSLENEIERIREELKDPYNKTIRRRYYFIGILQGTSRALHLIKVGIGEKKKCQ